MIRPLQYLIETTIWDAPIAIVGNGESQTKWQMNRDMVDVWAINKALWAYDPPIVVTAADHAEPMQQFVHELGNHSEVVIIGDQDALLYGLRRVSSFNLAMDFVLQNARSTIYLYGIDFSDARDWRGIAEAFALSLKHYRPRDLQYIGDAQPYLPMLVPTIPIPEHVQV